MQVLHLGAATINYGGHMTESRDATLPPHDAPAEVPFRSDVLSGICKKVALIGSIFAFEPKPEPSSNNHTVNQITASGVFVLVDKCESVCLFDQPVNFLSICLTVDRSDTKTKFCE